MASSPAWLFPTPVRRSRFVAADAKWSPFNIEVALDRIAPWSFSQKTVEPFLLFDYQTQLENNTPGRHGSGRAGVYLGHYVKGVGRTQAAGNWNDELDFYHASGHLAVGSALRERLITMMLTARGLGHTIVPCVSLLLARLRPEERRLVARGQSSSQAALTPADAGLMALSLKPANFARISNFVWAFDHFPAKPELLGALFLDFERYLNPPDKREGLRGAPASIARAMDGAFRRGLSNFQHFNRIGLFWIYTHNNFTLDGRFVDLETPLFLGAPFAGIFEQQLQTPVPYRFMGFESFAFVWYWRLFLRWFKAKLRSLASRSVLELPVARGFVREVARQIDGVFSPKHLLYSDARLQRKMVNDTGGALDLSRQARTRLAQLTDFAFDAIMDGADRRLPDMGWKPVEFRPAPPSVAPFQISAPAFLQPRFSSDGEAFARAVERLGSFREPQMLFAALAEESALQGQPG